MDLAQQVNAALRAAHAEHDDVMKRLGAAAAP
jgi:predicted kinase